MFRGFLGAAAAALLLLVAHPSRAAPALEVYGRLPDIEEVSLSASGKRLAMIKVVGEERRLVVLEPDGRVLVNAGVGDVKIADLDWAGDGKLLVTKRETAGGGLDTGWNRFEFGAVLVIDVDTGKQFWIFETAGKPGAVYGDYGVRQVGGKWYGYYAGIESTFAPIGLFEVDFDTGKERRIYLSTQGKRTRWLVNAEGAVAAQSEYIPESGSWALLGEGRRRVAENRSLEQAPGLVGFGRGFDTALVLEDGETGQVAREIPLRGGEPVRIGADVDIAGVLRDDAGRLIGLSGWDRTITFLDPKRQARWKGARKAFDGYVARLIDYTDDLGRLVVFTDGGDDSGTYWLVDVAAGGARPIGRAYGAVEPADVGPTRMIAYKASDGLAMEGLLTLPPGREAKNLPVIILPHGGPVSSGDHPGFDWWAQAFASRGYAVFQPNFRGTLGYGDAFERAAYGQWGAKMQTDLSDGLTELARQGLVDPKRACIVGASYGGYAALAGVTLQEGIYRCAASYGGVSDLKMMLDETADRSGRRGDTMRWWTTLMGAQARDTAKLHAVSPARQAARASAPILLIHGRDDTILPLDQSREMERELKRAGKPVELVVLDGEDHWLSRSGTRRAMLQATLAFVEKHNPPG